MRLRDSLWPHYGVCGPDYFYPSEHERGSSGWRVYSPFRCLSYVFLLRSEQRSQIQPDLATTEYRVLPLRALFRRARRCCHTGSTRVPATPSPRRGRATARRRRSAAVQGGCCLFVIPERSLLHGPVASPVTSPRSTSAPRSALFSASLSPSIVASIFASLPASLSASPVLHGPPCVDCDYRRVRLILSQSRRSIVDSTHWLPLRA